MRKHKINKGVRKALKIVRDQLAKASDSRYEDGWFFTLPGLTRAIPLFFDLSTWSSPRDCGTACCIGGAAMLVAPPRTRKIIETSDERYLHNLFYPSADGDHMAEVEPDDAVKAIDNYLKHGNARWGNVRPDLFISID